MRANPKGRQAKSKSRLQRFEELQSKETQARNETAELYIPPGERLGEKVIDVHHVSKGFGDRLLIDDLDVGTLRALEEAPGGGRRRHRRQYQLADRDDGRAGCADDPQDRRGSSA